MISKACTVKNNVKENADDIDRMNHLYKECNICKILYDQELYNIFSLGTKKVHPSHPCEISLGRKREKLVAHLPPGLNSTNDRKTKKCLKHKTKSVPKSELRLAPSTGQQRIIGEGPGDAQPSDPSMTSWTEFDLQTAII